MIRNLTLVVAMLSSGQALALSCMPHDLPRTYAEAAQSDESYIVVHGTLTFDEAKLPIVDYERQDQIPPHTLIPAQLRGKSLSDDGFSNVFDKPVTLDIQCFGPWCAGAKSGMPYLTFLQKTPEGYTMSLTPCGGFGFAEPSQKMLQKVTQCFNDGPCKPETL